MKKERKLNWREACKILGCGKDKFYGLIKRGYLPATRVGERGLMVKEADVKKLIQPVEQDEWEESREV